MKILQIIALFTLFASVMVFLPDEQGMAGESSSAPTPNSLVIYALWFMILIPVFWFLFNAGCLSEQEHCSVLMEEELPDLIVEARELARVLSQMPEETQAVQHDIDVLVWNLQKLRIKAEKADAAFDWEELYDRLGKLRQEAIKLIAWLKDRLDEVVLE